MEITSLVLARKVEQQEDTSVNVRGSGLSAIQVKGFPASLPEGTSLYLVLRLQPPEFSQDFKVEMIMTPPDGKVFRNAVSFKASVAPYQADPSRPMLVPVHLLIEGMYVGSEGLHRFDVVVNDTESAWLDLGIIYKPQDPSPRG